MGSSAACKTVRTLAPGVPPCRRPTTHGWCRHPAARKSTRPVPITPGPHRPLAMSSRPSSCPPASRGPGWPRPQSPPPTPPPELPLKNQTAPAASPPSRKPAAARVNPAGRLRRIANASTKPATPSQTPTAPNQGSHFPDPSGTRVGPYWLAAVDERQIGGGFRLGGVQQEAALIVKDRASLVAEPVVGIAEVVKQVGTEPTLVNRRLVSLCRPSEVTGSVALVARGKASRVRCTTSLGAKKN